MEEQSQSNFNHQNSQIKKMNLNKQNNQISNIQSNSFNVQPCI